MTTEQKISKLIKISPFHAAYVALCLDNFNNEILQDTGKFIEQHKNDLVNPQSWIDCANDARRILND